MTLAEIDTFVARQRLFERRGFTPREAERLADELVLRDRGKDDRRCCMECRYLHGDGAYRCGNAAKADVRPKLASGFEVILRRCLGFSYADQ